MPESFKVLGGVQLTAGLAEADVTKTHTGVLTSIQSFQSMEPFSQSLDFTPREARKS